MNPHSCLHSLFNIPENSYWEDFHKAHKAELLFFSCTKWGKQYHSKIQNRFFKNPTHFIKEVNRILKELDTSYKLVQI